MTKALTLASLIVIISTSTFAARILGIAPTASYSHHRVLQPIWRELSLRGHELIVITTDPINDPTLTNLREIDVHNMSYSVWNETINYAIESRQQSVYKSIYIMTKATHKIAEMQFQHEEVQALIKNETEHFDLVIVEFLLPIYYAYAEYFKCPFVGVTTMEPPIFSYDFIGNPNHPAISPDGQFHYDKKLTFLQRMLSTFTMYTSELMMKILFSGEEQEIINRSFGKEMPPIMDIARNVSLLFLNTEPVLHPIKSLVPSVIQIGGNMHSRVITPLPKEVKETLDNATQGFIYFSLGTNVRCKDLPIELLEAILETFAEVPFQVLWKFESDYLPNKPENVIISKWFPQQGMLRHPNIKLFITQGGLQSMEEAMSSYVPMIGIPFFADQYQNVRKMVEHDMGLFLDFKTLNKVVFKNTIMEVIQNTKYKEKVTEIGQLVQDQPMTGLEKVVWWTEYVIRHKGAKHLRSPFLDLPTYQFFLLDVIGAFVLLFILFIAILVFIVKCLIYLTKKFKVKID